MVFFSAPNTVNAVVDMSDAGLVDFNAFDSDDGTGHESNIYSWRAGPEPFTSDVNLLGTFVYGIDTERPLAAGSSITSITIDINNFGGDDILVTGTEGLNVRSVATARTDAIAFWNLVLGGDDVVTLTGLVGTSGGVNVIFGDDLAAASVTGNPTAPVDFGGSDNMTGGDAKLDLIGDVFSVIGLFDGVQQLKAYYGAGSDTISAFPTDFANRLIGDAFTLGGHATLQAGNDVIDTLAGLVSGALLIGDAFEQVGGTLLGGNDTLKVGYGEDQSATGDVQEFYKGTLQGGHDTITLRTGGTAAGDVFLVGANNGTVLGGDDHITGRDGGDLLVGDIYDPGNKTLSLTGGADELRGGGGDDRLFGETGIGEPSPGSGGDDALYGSGGDDELHGQTGDDLLVGGLDDDLLDGGSGSDTASYATASSLVRVSLKFSSIQNTKGGGNDTLNSIENLTGSEFDDYLADNSKANVIDGGGGDDLIEAGGGKDSLIGGDGKDTVSYALMTKAIEINLAAGTASGAGQDSLSGFENAAGGEAGDGIHGSSGANVLKGGDGGDLLDGKGGSDLLDGEAGNDRLDGGVGKDRLTGGAGRDTFVFGPGSGVDIIKDFTDSGGPEDDVINVKAYGFSSKSAIGKVASGDNLVLNFHGGNTVTLTDYLKAHSLADIADDLVI